jgi:hypothetical protein
MEKKMTDKKDFPANRKASEVKLSRKEMFKIRLFVGCGWVIYIGFVIFCLVNYPGVNQ